MGFLPRRKSNWRSILLNSSFYWCCWINIIMVNETSIRFSRISWIYNCRTLLSICDDAWNDYGSLFFNSFISRRFWKLFNTFNGWCKRYGISICEYVELLDVLCCCSSLNGKLLCSRWPNWCWMDFISSSNYFRGNSRQWLWNFVNVNFIVSIRYRFHDGRIKLYDNYSPSQNKRNDTYENATNCMGYFHCNSLGHACISCAFSQLNYDDT